ncbi:MAG TPA: hypothetical protein VN519_06560 [Bryobacteraceae bacterium]|nr:hypothetical protein [Bryobacteraceae bacterium]
MTETEQIIHGEHQVPKCRRTSHSRPVHPFRETEKSHKVREDRTVNFYCIAQWRGDAMEQARKDEDPDVGGWFYGEPTTGEPCEFRDMEAVLFAPGAKVFPEGDWAATDEAMEALHGWMAGRPCPETLDLFAATTEAV